MAFCLLPVIHLIATITAFVKGKRSLGWGLVTSAFVGVVIIPLLFFLLLALAFGAFDSHDVLFHGMPHEAYFQTRYAVLRQPLGMALGSERLDDDAEAVHAWAEQNGKVIAVGRAHIIPEHADGPAWTTKGQAQPNSSVWAAS